MRTKYGTRKELEAAMKKLNENQIAIYIDAVLNHKMGANGTETFKVNARGCCCRSDNAQGAWL